MKFFVRVAGSVALLAACLHAVTLERLSLDEMIDKSTAIVRGRVISSEAKLHGLIIYTHFQVQVLERWKGPESSQVDVAVPGGSAGGLQQTFSGTPALAPGDEYVFFLWTGDSRITHVIGLSQGVFSLRTGADGSVTAIRSASLETMLDSKTGRIVSDETVRMRLTDLRSRVTGRLESRGTK